MSKAKSEFHRRVTDIMSLGLATLFIVIFAIITIGSCVGCGGEAFTRLDTAAKIDAGPDDAEAETGISIEAGVDAPWIDHIEVDAHVIETPDAAPDAIETPDAPVEASCPFPSMLSVLLPPECGSGVAVKVPSEYARVQMTNGAVTACNVMTTPAACGVCAFNCACLLDRQVVGKSCSCRIVDSALPVVTCQ